MRKLKLQMQISLDGFVAGPNGEMDWLVWNWDDELKEYINNLTANVDCILLGRILAQGFINHWASLAEKPEGTDENIEFAKKINSMQKIVFSRTLERAEWKNTRLVNDNIEGEIAQLKEQDGEDIIIYGGASIVSSLLKPGLIDELHLFVNPVALGDGKPIFKNREEKLSLQLIGSKAFPCGIVVLNYQL